MQMSRSVTIPTTFFSAFTTGSAPHPAVHSTSIAAAQFKLGSQNFGDLTMISLTCINHLEYMR